MSLSPLFNPKKRKPGPKPARVNLRIIIVTGLIVWGLSFLYVTIIEMWIKQLPVFSQLLITCFGMIIGVLLLLWEVIYRDKYYPRPENRKKKLAKPSTSPKRT